MCDTFDFITKNWREIYHLSPSGESDKFLTCTVINLQVSHDEWAITCKVFGWHYSINCSFDILVLWTWSSITLWCYTAHMWYMVIWLAYCYISWFDVISLWCVRFNSYYDIQFLSMWYKYRVDSWLHPWWKSPTCVLLYWISNEVYS